MFFTQVLCEMICNAAVDLSAQVARLWRISLNYLGVGLVTAVALPAIWLHTGTAI